MRGQHGELTRRRVNCNSICPLQRDAGKPREAEDAGTGGRKIDHPTSRKRPLVGNRNHHTAAIRMVGDTHTATEWQCLVRSCQRPIVQGATTGRFITGRRDRTSSLLGKT